MAIVKLVLGAPFLLLFLAVSAGSIHYYSFPETNVTVKDCLGQPIPFARVDLDYRVPTESYFSPRSQRRDVHKETMITDKAGIIRTQHHSVFRFGFIFREGGYYIISVFRTGYTGGTGLRGDRIHYRECENACGFYYLKHYKNSNDRYGVSGSFSAQEQSISFVLHKIVKGMGDWRESLKMQEESGDKQGMATSLNMIGNIYREVGDFQGGLDYFFKSLKIQEEIGDREGMVTSLKDIGGLYGDFGDFEKESEYLNKSLEIEVELENEK